MKKFWREGLVLLLVMIISILLVRRFTKGDTLENYAQRQATTAATGTEANTTDDNENGTSGDNGDGSVLSPGSQGVNEDGTQGDKQNRPHLSPNSDTTVTNSATPATTSLPAPDDSVNTSTGSNETGAKTTSNEDATMNDSTTRPDGSTQEQTNQNLPLEGELSYRPGFTSAQIPDHIFQRMQGKSFPDDCSIPREDLRYLTVQYIDFTGETQQGELVCNKAIAQDLLEIFEALYEAQYPIQSIRLIDDYNADDDLSVAANNTSCFCYRVVEGTTRLSNHAKGLAIDINPMYNPYVKFNSDGTPYTKLPVCAPYIDRSDATHNPYRIDTNDLCYQLFTQHGFSWGGAWRSSRDYQHFEKE